MDAVGAMELSPAECASLLRSACWGRVAISMQTIAMVIPVPVRVVEDRVVFATARGSRFDRAVQGQPISVQVEGREPALDDGELLWSVVVSGICAPDRNDDADGDAGGEGDGEPDAAVHRVNAVPFSMLQGFRAPMPPDLLPSRPPRRLPDPPPPRS